MEEKNKENMLTAYFKKVNDDPNGNAIVKSLWDKAWFVMIISLLDFIWSVKIIRFFVWLLVASIIVGRTNSWATGKLVRVVMPAWSNDVFVSLITIFGLIIVSAIGTKVFGGNKRNLKKAIIFIVIAGVFVNIANWVDARHFNAKGEATRWVNISTGEINKTPNNTKRKVVGFSSVYLPIIAPGFFYIDAVTGDTCVPANRGIVKWVHDRIEARYLTIYRPVIQYEWKEVFNETYSYRDADGNNDILTNLKGYSMKIGDRLKIKNINSGSNVVKLWVGRKNHNWIYADKIDGEAEIIVTRSYSNTADKPIIIQIDGKGNARVILERKVPV